jgi:predicted transcriptional regulator
MGATMSFPRFTLRGFRRPREALGLTFGKLEREVMETVWRLGEVRVRDVHEAFDGRLAYTTVMTTLDRLHKKGLLERRKLGRAFLYTPRMSRAELTHGIAHDLIDGLLEGGRDVEPVLACIVDAVTTRDRALLDELDRLIAEKKRELRTRG